MVEEEEASETDFLGKRLELLRVEVADETAAASGTDFDAEEDEALLLFLLPLPLLLLVNIFFP